MHMQSFIRGITIGFVLGILFAPDSGTETRRKIAGKASDIKEKKIQRSIKLSRNALKKNHGESPN